MFEKPSLWNDTPVALVTGAAARVGRELAMRLGQLGASVAVHFHRSAEGAESTAEAIKAAGGKAAIFNADLSKGASASHTLVENVSQQLGPVRVLINNAARFEPATLSDLCEADCDEMWAVNLKAPLFLCQAVAEALPSDVSGHMIQLADWRGVTPVPGHLTYTLSKSALVAMTRLLAQELGPQFQVNAIAPGVILPPPGVGEEHLQSMAAGIPLRRAGSPAELSDAMEFLLRSDFVTGEVIHVTGGQQLSCRTRANTHD